jgi:hypothetical protein
MKPLVLAIALTALAQTASADPISWDYQALPLVLTHPEFFGGGDHQQPGAADGGWQGQQASDGGSQGQQASDGQNGHGLLLSDDLSTSRQDDDGGTQSGGQNHGQNGPSQNGPSQNGPSQNGPSQNGPGQNITTGPTDQGFTFTSQEDDVSISTDFLSPSNDPGDISVVQTGAAPISEPASFMLVLSALLGVALASSRDRYPARRYCTASSRRNR